MKQLISLIDKLSEFGLRSDVISENKILELKRCLIGIYNFYLNGDDCFDERDYHEDFEFSYNQIRNNVAKNFPDLDLYIHVWNIDELKYEKGSEKLIIESGLGDPIDDVSDIIKDMLEVKWRIDNTSEEDAIWHFNLLMKNHSENHIIEILKYLKDKFK